ncbi:MAG: UDP-4-amino-4,6-dideoxy-N-acetyl-beta-L-altrosamine transaminase [Bacteroidetes bacterium]|nr:UDP-4-amino-4,6-dideoxy-N-acetyl-beta-L-altrosamine transaminase [Bacteroidota bacterium]
MNVIPYGRQDITEADIDAVVKVLKSDYLTQGPVIEQFETSFAEYVGAKYAVAVSNGTAALHLCAMAMNLKPGQKVITSPITFAATANCIRYCGGEVVFADIDPNTYLLDLEQVKRLVESEPRATFAGIIPVDFAGRAVDLESFRKLANEDELWIIEDACHAPGGFFIDTVGRRQNCGNGNFADCAIFSFHPVKHIATGEGGMVTTNNEETYHRLRALRTHGITKDSSRFLNSPTEAFGLSVGKDAEYPGWYMEMQELGYNYRLSDIQAALGLSQLTRAAGGLQRRREIGIKYRNAFRNLKGIQDRNTEAIDPETNGHAHHLYVIECDQRAELYQSLRSKGIYSQIHYVPTHLMPYYRSQGWKPGDLPAAESYYSRCISLPMFPSMTDADVDRVINEIRSFLQSS